MEQASYDLKRNEISLMWKIHNFSYSARKTNENGYIESPDFELDDLKCYFHLFPSGCYNNCNVAFRFCLRARNISYQLTSLSCEVSILKTSGLFQTVGLFSTREINHNAYSSSFSPVNLPCFHKDKYAYKDYLYNDTLTVKFRIFNANITLDRSICCAYTVINVQRTIYNWKIDTVCNSNKITFAPKAVSNLFKIQDFTLDVSFVKEESSDDGKVEVVIKRSNVYINLFSTCTVSIVEDGRILYSKKNERWFDQMQGEQVWNVTCTLNINFINHKKDCRRFLCFEFATADGSTVEKVEYGSTTNSVLSLVSKPSTNSNAVLSWQDNLQQFYSEGKLSDVTLQTPEKEFPAHKVMLCAQSKVFSAMFEHDTKENQTGIVEIQDLENETVSRMLNFVYTGVFENIDWEVSTKLYFAADKYEITALKEQCSVFFKTNLGTSNVCKCLILADMHQDPSLKTFAQEFVQKHSSDIMKSDEWMELMKNYVSLAAETMYLMCLKSS